ncbi:T9SS type A sorting domain-containing protein [bacterium]|nr:MAG: T9SS type A sorting domain-containing protein [bacterium]
MKTTVTLLLALISFFGFTPNATAQIPTSGLRLHLKADAGTSTTTPGQKISQWNDQSGNGFHATEANTNWQPTYVNDGGIPAVRFNPSAPTDMNLPTHSTLGLVNSENEIFIVSRTSSSAVQFPFAGGINFNEIHYNGASGVRYIAKSGLFVDNPADADNGAFHLINAVATTTNIQLGVDGVFATTAGDGTHAIDVAFNLGTRSDGSNRFDGDIAEIIVYNRKLSNAESMQVSEYLKNKYSTPFTAYGAPQTPASGFNFTGVTKSSMNVNLTKGSGTHRVVVARKGGSVTVAPTNGVAYTGSGIFGAGSNLGDGNFVIYAGTDGTSTALSGLEFNSSYHFAVYEYYLVGGVPQYGSAVSGNQTTVDLTQASSLSIISRTDNAFTGGVSAGNGTYRLVVARAGSAVNQAPSNGVSYTGNATFGAGSEIGSGNYVIYAGSDGSSFSLNGLAASSVYHLAAYEYEVYNGVPKYQVVNPPVNSGITYPSSSASAVQFSSVGLDQMTVSFTAGNGQNRLVIVREGQAVSAIPGDGQNYSANSSFGSGQDLGSGNYVAYKGNGNSFTLTGLSNSTTYFVAVYEFNEYNGTICFKTTSPAVGSQSTTLVPFPTLSAVEHGDGTATTRSFVYAVNPNGWETTADFIYGTDNITFGSTAAGHSVGSGAVDLNDTLTVTGLTLGQTYYGKVRVTNLRGSVESEVFMFIPMSTTDMKAWWRADYGDYILGGANNNFLKDMSGNVHDLKLGSGAPARTLSVNGKTALEFTGSNDLRISASDLGVINTDIEIFIVFKTTNTNQQYLLSTSTNSLLEIGTNVGAGLSAGSYYDRANTGSLNAFTDGNPHVMHFKGNSTSKTIRVDNGDYAVNANTGTLVSTEIYFGSINHYSSRDFIGQIAEIMIFASTLSAEQRMEISQYLSTRYAVSVYNPSIPSIEASNLAFTSIQPTGFSVSMDAGNGTERLIVARLSSSQKTAPTEGVSYSANPNFGSGSHIGNGNYVVGKGTGTSVSLTGLAASSEYTIDVYEYDLMEGLPIYGTSSTASTNQSTTSVIPPAVSLYSVENTHTSTPSVIAFVNPNSYATTAQVVFGTSYDNLNMSTSAQAVGSQSSEQSVQIALSGISANTTYYYKVVAENVGGSTESEIVTFTYREHISLPSLKFWASGDQATYTASSGEAVSNWSNQSGKATKAYQINVADSPTRVTDSGVSVLRFDGSSDFLELPLTDSLGLINNNYEVFIVAKTSSASIGFLMGGPVPNYEIHTRPGSEVGTRFIPKSGYYIDNPINSTDGEFHIINAKATSSSGGLRIDGNSVTGNSNALVNASGNLILGARRDGTYYFDGDIAEVLIYNAELTELELAHVEHYLAAKYAVTLPYYFVTNTLDDNVGSGQYGSLRYVLNTINTAAPEATTVVDMSKISGTITLTSDLPAINYDMQINGPGSGSLTISGNNLYRPFFIGSGLTPFTPEIPAAPTVTMQGLAVTNGYGKGGNAYSIGGGGAGMGAAIFVNDGNVTLNNMLFEDNTVQGGASYSAGGGSGQGGGFASDALNSNGGYSGYLGGNPGVELGESGGVGAGGNSGRPNGGHGGFAAGGGSGAVVTQQSDPINGGNGGFGGGGGAAAEPNGIWLERTPGVSAFGGGSATYSGSTNYGGGGAGMGGAVFNRSGQVFIQNSVFNRNTAIGGIGGQNTEINNGKSYGGAIFNANGVVILSNNTFGTAANANVASNEADFYDYSDIASSLITVSDESNISETSFDLHAQFESFGLSGTYRVIYGANASNLSSVTSSQNFDGSIAQITVNETINSVDLTNFLFYKIEVSFAQGVYTSDLRRIMHDESVPSDSLKLWLSAGRGLTISTGSSVAAWLDGTSIENDFVQTGIPNQPVVVQEGINSQPVIRFNGINQYLASLNPENLGITDSDYELFIVLKSASDAIQFVWSAGVGHKEIQLNGSSGVRFISTGDKYVDAGSSTQYTDGTARIINVQSTDALGSIRVNNELVGLLNSSTRSANVSDPILGTRTGGSFYYDGDIAEVIVYNKALDISTRNTINAYLSGKYAIDLVNVSEPTIQASSPQVISKTTNSLGFSVHKGNGSKRFVLAKATTAVDAVPVDGNIYSPNSVFGSGEQLGTGNYAIPVVSDSTIYLTGLTPGTTYNIAVFEYNGVYEKDYLTTTPLTFSTKTLTSVPTNSASSAIAIGGADEGVRIAHNPEFIVDKFTLELWFNPTAGVTDVPFLTAMDGEELEIHLINSNKSIRFIPTVGVYLDSPANVFEFGKWNHIAVSYNPDESFARMVINGNEVALTNNGSNPLTTALRNTGLDLLLGARKSYALCFEGQIDEFRFWNDIRTVEEIRSGMFTNISSGFENLLVNLQFNEGSGTTTVDPISGTNAVLENMEFNGTNGWRDSAIPFGQGDYAAFTDLTSGSLNASDLNITITEDFDNTVSVLTKRFTVEPNLIPSGNTINLNNQYWVVYEAGNAGAYKASLTFTVPESLMKFGEVHPTQFTLYRRDFGSVGNWQEIRSSANSTTSNTVTFDTLSQFGQFMIARDFTVGFDDFAGSSILFDGTNDFLSIPYNSAFTINKLTMEFWFKWSHSGSAVEFVVSRGSEEWEVHLGMGSNGIRFIPRYGVYIDTPAEAFTPGEWTHFAAVYDPSQSLGKIYINGVDATGATSGSLAQAIMVTNNPVNIGRRQVSQNLHFAGEIDEFRIWNSARTQQEISDNKNSSLSDDYYPDLVAYFQFNEGGGTLTSENQNDLSASMSNFNYDSGSNWKNSTIPMNQTISNELTFTGTEGWRLVSTPVVDSTYASFFDGIWTQGFTGATVPNGFSNVYTWPINGSDRDSTNWVPLSNAASSFQRGSGALVYVFSDDNGSEVEGDAGFPKTLQIDGFTPYGDVNLNSLLNPNAGGWTLLGNPFNTNIDWDLVNKTNVTEAVYVWDNSASTWKTWNGSVGTLSDGIIGSFNGFFVETSASSPTLSISETAKVTSDAIFLGKANTSSQNESNTKEIVALSLQVKNNQGLENESWIEFSNEGLLNKDRFDAIKLVPLTSEYVQVSTQLENGKLLDINTLPLEFSQLDIPVHVNSTFNGTHQLSLQAPSVPEHWTIRWFDTQSGVEYAMDDVITFDYAVSVKKSQSENSNKPEIQSQSTSESRFILRIKNNLVSSIENEIPTEFGLSQNYPNPFNPSTTIKFSLPKADQVSLEIYDVTGRLVQTLVNGMRNAGYHQVQFNASGLASGLYFYRLSSKQGVVTKKLMLIK